jgi:TatD DNase family protein
MLTDSHAHLDDSRFDTDRDALIRRAWDAGVNRILTIGNGKGPDDMGCGIPVAEAHSWIFTTVGVHPHDASKTEERHYEMMETLAQHPKVLAIGETGLDYHYEYSPRDVQRRVFQRQVELASKLQLPVIIHAREADEETAQILREVGHPRGVLHCFTSGSELAEAALELGFMISFSGIITFPNARNLVGIARRIPADRLLLETDCPYLAPVPHRGKRNEPAFVLDTARFLAECREVTLEQLASQTSANFTRLFSPAETA